jgi:hypothetical protein
MQFEEEEDDDFAEEEAAAPVMPPTNHRQPMRQPEPELEPEPEAEDIDEDDFDLDDGFPDEGSVPAAQPSAAAMFQQTAATAFDEDDFFSPKPKAPAKVCKRFIRAMYGLHGIYLLH